MGPIAFDTLTAKLFESLADVEGFSYTSDELNSLYDTVKPTKKGSKKMKTSAYKMFQAEYAGTPQADKPIWKDIKEDPDKFQVYFERASKKNEELGFSSDDDKILKKQKTKNKNDALKAAIAATKKQKNEEKTEPETSENSSSEPDEVSISPVQEANTDTFDSIDKNNDGVISREEFENYIDKSSNDSLERIRSNLEDTNSSEDEVVTEDENDTDTSSLPLFEGKSPKTALNNFKQWVLKQKSLEFNSTIKRDDMNSYKEEYGFDKDKYDDSCEWFEFIQNNMRIE